LAKQRKAEFRINLKGGDRRMAKKAVKKAAKKTAKKKVAKKKK
jgi:hypothetical protein